jgi:DNA-binding CsgD family transcriptional regulator
MSVQPDPPSQDPTAPTPLGPPGGPRLVPDTVMRKATDQLPAVAYLMVVNFPEWHWPILDCEQLIGRAADADIHLPGRFCSASRRHAAVWADTRGHLWIRDVGSQMGTAVNGVLLSPHRPTRIIIGDRLLLGGVELEVLATATSATSVAQYAEDDASTEVDETRPHSPQRRYADAPARLLADLTPAELEIVLWISRGYTSLRAMGRKLHRSPHTVRTQLGSVFRKTDTHSRDELIGRLRRGGGASAEEDSASK